MIEFLAFCIVDDREEASVNVINNSCVLPAMIKMLILKEACNM